MYFRWLNELRRRHLLRVAGAYVAVGWAVLQVADALVPVLALPDWTLTFVALLLLIGLPVSVAVAWMMALPAAAASAGEAAPTEVSAGSLWIDGLLLALIVFAIGISVWQIASRHGLGSGAGDGSAPLSVAVLPFTSFSDDPDDNYFADGLTEELINELAQLPIKVPGRTSSFYFKNRNEDLRDIGRQLGVGNVLEGSVRRSGEQLRVTVQLIDIEDGFHVWSRTYDRKLRDAFAIQNDIAGQVAAALKVTLLAGDAVDEDSAEVAGYPSYLIAIARLRERNRESVTEARTIFHEILDQDADNVAALAGYAQATMLLAGAYLSIDFEPAAVEADKAVGRALALSPDSVDANVAAGLVNLILGQRTDEQAYLVTAERALARAVDLAPYDPDVLVAYGSLLATLGRWEAAVKVTRRGLARDPLHRSARLQLAEALRGSGRLGEARTELETVLAGSPNLMPAELELGELLIETGALELALPHLLTAHDARSSPRATFALANVYLNIGLDDAVRRTLGELDYAPSSMPLGDMVLRQMAGDDRATLAFAEQQVAATGDRIWRPMVVLLALNTGELTRARREMRRLEPAVLQPDFPVHGAPPAIVLLAGSLLMAEGRTEQARRLVEALLERLAPPAQGYDAIGRKLARAHALALLGRTDEALGELADARRQGYRTLYDFDNFMRIDRYPEFAQMRADERFQRLIAEIEADNRKAGQRVEAASSRG